MPIIKSAIKRVKQATKRHERNVGIKKNIKLAVKSFTAKPSAETLSRVQSEIDTAVKKKLIKKSTAARRKSQIAKEAKEAGVKLGTAKKAAAKKTTTKATTTTKKTEAPAKKTSSTTKAKAPAKKASTAKKESSAKKTATKK